MLGKDSPPKPFQLLAGIRSVEFAPKMSENPFKLVAARHQVRQVVLRKCDLRGYALEQIGNLQLKIDFGAELNNAKPARSCAVRI